MLTPFCIKYTIIFTIENCFIRVFELWNFLRSRGWVIDTDLDSDTYQCQTRNRNIINLRTGFILKSPLNPNSYQSKYHFENYYGSAEIHVDYGKNEKRRIYNVL